MIPLVDASLDTGHHAPLSMSTAVDVPDGDLVASIAGWTAGARAVDDPGRPADPGVRWRRRFVGLPNSRG